MVVRRKNLPEMRADNHVRKSPVVRPALLADPFCITKMKIKFFSESAEKASECTREHLDFKFSRGGGGGGGGGGMPPDPPSYRIFVRTT